MKSLINALVAAVQGARGSRVQLASGSRHHCGIDIAGRLRSHFHPTMGGPSGPWQLAPPVFVEHHAHPAVPFLAAIERNADA